MNATQNRRPARPAQTPRDTCAALVARIADATGDEWTFGYIGDVSRHGDDRGWFAFRAHPGRVGTAADRIGGHGTADLDKLADVLRGALAMARMLKA
jgi:hypothetical protein